MASVKSKTTGWPASFVKEQTNNTLDDFDRPGVTLLVTVFIIIKFIFIYNK